MKRTTALFYFCLICFSLHAQKIKWQTPVIEGEFVHVFNPNLSRNKEDTTWYTNDHCFAKGKDGSWHAYGIIGHEPIDPWKGETRLFHASSKTLLGINWKDEGDALIAEPGKERVLWAPHIISEKDTFFMFYNIGNMQPNAPLLLLHKNFFRGGSEIICRCAKGP